MGWQVFEYMGMFNVLSRTRKNDLPKTPKVTTYNIRMIYVVYANFGRSYFFFKEHYKLLLKTN